MEYSKVDVPRELVRKEVLQFLRERRDAIVFTEPTGPAIAAGNAIAADLWFKNIGQLGLLDYELIDEVDRRLRASGAAKSTPVPVNDGVVARAFNTYYATYPRYLIAEEILRLIGDGILIQVRLGPDIVKGSHACRIQFGGDRLVLTEYGARVVADPLLVPYFVEEYLGRLRQSGEPDEELVGYLAEGLVCLQNRLARAAAILLRLAAEHTLRQLVDSTLAALHSRQSEKAKLQGQVRSAGIRIEERAEAIFKKLESSPDLVPNKNKDLVTLRLRPAFHSIRDLGGRASHLAAPIQQGEVRDHYTLYVTSVYVLVAEIIAYQEATFQ